MTCWMHGHMFLTHCEPGRLSLRCGWCGYETVGWNIGPQGRPQLVWADPSTAPPALSVSVKAGRCGGRSAFG
jgi:hypothetical protein